MAKPGASHDRQVHIQILGGFHATYGSEPIEGLNTVRLQSFLAYLLLHRNAPVARQQLAYALWPETSDHQARTNLRTLLARFRKVAGAVAPLLDIGRQTVRLLPSTSLHVDLIRLETVLHQTEQAAAAPVPTEALEEAIRLYRGDLLPDCYDEWILSPRERLRERFLTALDQYSRRLEDARTYAQSIRVCRRLLRHDPLNETTYRRLMRLHALQGDRGSALRVYHQCADVLQRDLNVDPAHETQAAYRQLLNQNEAATVRNDLKRDGVPLVGRAHQWRTLTESWRTVRQERSAIIAITGEPGVGKSRLAEELVVWAAQQGILTATTRCHVMGDETAYAPIITLLRTPELVEHWVTLDDLWLIELTRLAPDLIGNRPDLTAPAPLQEPWQRQRFHEAMTRALLSARRPLLLWIDDLQWCGGDLLDWLHHLLHAATVPLLVVSTLRIDDVADDHPYAAFRLGLQRDGLLTELPLDPFTAAESAAMAEAVTGRSLNADETAALYLQTEGYPLFIVEMSRAAMDSVPLEPDVPPAEAIDATPASHLPPLPQKVAAVLEYRLAQLSPPTRAILQLAAVIGREFTFDILQRACNEPEDSVVAALDEGWRRYIVREQGQNAYDFSHEKLRAVAYAKTSPARRRLYHRRVAETLIQQATNSSANDAQIAQHYANAELNAEAIPYFLQAAESARQIYDNERAITAYRRGIELLDDLAAGDEAEVAASRATMRMLREGLGDVYVRAGSHALARNVYCKELAQLSATAQGERCRLLRKLGDSHYTQHDHDTALSYYRQAEACLTVTPSAAQGPLLQTQIELQLSLMKLHYGSGNSLELGAILEKLAPVITAYGTKVARAQYVECRALYGLRQDRYFVSDATLMAQREALSAWEETDDQAGIANNQFSLGFCHLWRRDEQQAEGHFTAALERAEAIGHARVRMLCLTYLTVLQRFQQAVAKTADFANESLTLSTQIDAPYYVGIAHANLAWVALRRADFEQAERLSRAALELMPAAYPFRWAALWPLLAIASRAGDPLTAQACIDQLLDPSQQRLPDDLTRLLHRTRRSDVAVLTAERPPYSSLFKLAAQLGYL